MTITFRDLLERLKQVDEISLLELLEIDSEMLVERFKDQIELKEEQLVTELEDEEEVSREGFDE